MHNFSSFVDELVDGVKVSDPIREQYIEEQYEELLEKLITFGGKAYPKFGNVVIMAGGAGSGKGFVKDTLVGIEGYTFDVDELKRLAVASPMIQKRVKKDLGQDLKKIGSDLTNPDNVGKLHAILGDYLNLDDRRMKTLYTSILTAPPDRKPNIIFDVTLKDLQKLEKITRQVSAIGYPKENVHIVWVVNDIEVAKAQNKDPKRGRVVPADILVNTHRGASATMNDILNMGKGLRKYMDGDIAFAFNKIGVDTDLEKSGSPNSKRFRPRHFPKSIGINKKFKGAGKGNIYAPEIGKSYKFKEGFPLIGGEYLRDEKGKKIKSLKGGTMVHFTMPATLIPIERDGAKPSAGYVKPSGDINLIAPVSLKGYDKKPDGYIRIMAVSTANASTSDSGKGGQYVVDANYFYVKRRGKPPTPVAKLEKEIRMKITKYVPKGIDW